MLLRNRSCVCPELVLAIDSIRSLLAFISMSKLTTKRLFCAEYLAALAPGLGEEADASRHVLALLEPAARTVEGLHHVWCGRNGLFFLQGLLNLDDRILWIEIKILFSSRECLDD